MNEPGKENPLRDFFASTTHRDRYALRKLIGEGTYGQVCEAEDRLQGGKIVAVKRIPNLMSSRHMAVRILRELKFLRLLKGHENIIGILDVLVPSDR